MDKIKILLLGSSGMLGHVVEKILQQNPNIELYTKKNWHFPNDQVNFHKYYNHFKYIINCVGAVKPTIKENKEDTILNAIYANSILPHELCVKCPEATIIQPLTDCEFSGAKGNYNEYDLADVGDIYGLSKAIGSKVCTENFIGLRTSIIGFELNNKRSLIEWFYNLPQNSKIKGWDLALWNGIGCLQWAKIVNGIIDNNYYLRGDNNIIPLDIVSKYELLNIFKDVFRREDIEIEKIPGENINRTLSTIDPLTNLILWENAGYEKPPTVRQMVQELYEWTKDNFPQKIGN